MIIDKFAESTASTADWRGEEFYQQQQQKNSPGTISNARSSEGSLNIGGKSYRFRQEVILACRSRIHYYLF
uniref:Uncharacterized protein n=1 Tax=Ditylenchus dipsaci TaxID=166011 RepID=A0A915DH36_9BILA